MPRGYRCIFIAAVGWLALCGAKPQEQASPNATPSRQQSSVSHPSPTATTEPYRPYPSVKDPGCYRDKNHDSADLCAQWRAALAAEEATQDGYIANIVAGIGAILSFASVIIVVIALGQTRRANKLAEDTAKRQLRAYIAVEPLGVEEFAENGFYRVPINIINNGQTPAYNLELFGDFLIVEGDPREFDPVADGRLMEEGATTDSALGPNSNRVTYAYIEANLVNSNHNALEAKTKAIVHYGYLRYKDAFGEPRKSCFAFYHWGEELSATESKRCRFGNGAD